MEEKPASGLISTAHETVRDQHRDERTEDYVEAIYRLDQRDQPTRVVDLQGVFGVSHVTVIRALEKLEGDGLVTRATKGIYLTSTGKELAVACYDRHHTVETFLLALGVSPEVAARDTEGIEHHLSRESLQAMRLFIRRQDAKQAS